MRKDTPRYSQTERYVYIVIQTIKCQEIQREGLTLCPKLMPWDLNSCPIINDSANVCVHLGGEVEIVDSYNFVQL